MTRIYQRDTRTFNSYFNASRYTKVGGAFESGKVDNMYSLYEAGGREVDGAGAGTVAAQGGRRLGEERRGRPSRTTT